ncbi:ABC transporter ATP-binding protein [Vagococcus elongatus]|uniref:Spermidine/putrescine ABC transporter ATP-binding protein n=1 Tax=Vagococcus elongatus TaxID=180344 RepID=A0A430B1U5_9ENTE|nr:ATP-binding cassette domain-containing protein [Vagococcus elongatus]RSU14296.1 spermidine/putrescine ABC transporter ATP-binding protein [Vagococcus elongatus]
MPILTLENVSFESKQQKIIKNIDLSVEEGAFLTLTGPSGSGKSTLLKLIASLITPTDGKILFENQFQSSFQLTDYRQQVSYCFQQPALFGATVKDNLVFPFLVRDEEFNQEMVQEHLELVDLPTSFLDKKITEISGGEKQRVALIRNILFLPKILLLDEVTSGLDEKSKEIVLELIRLIHTKGVTVLKVTHDEIEIQEAEHIITIVKGEILNGTAGGE